MSTSLTDAPPPGPLAERDLAEPDLAEPELDGRESAERELSRSPLSPALRDAVRADADRVDHDTTDLRPLLRRLAADGLVDLGAPGARGTLLDQAQVIDALARSCMSSAFTLWAHRMTVQYLAMQPTERTRELCGQLRRAERPGSTAMAGALRDVVGIAELPVTFRWSPAGLVLHGTVTWASNVYDDAVIVTAARHPDTNERVIVALDASTPGLDIVPASDLLALGSTRSGSLRLNAVEVPNDRIISDDVPAYLRQVQPVFLVLQSAFCLGLATAALQASPEPTGITASFLTERDQLADRLSQLNHRLRALADLADQATTSDHPGIRTYLQLRLDAGHLTRAATDLELCLTGGRGYVARSPTARRMRESLFLPVQSPTEGQLRWELSRSD